MIENDINFVKWMINMEIRLQNESSVSLPKINSAHASRDGLKSKLARAAREVILIFRSDTLEH